MTRFVFVFSRRRDRNANENVRGVRLVRGESRVGRTRRGPGDTLYTRRFPRVGRGLRGVAQRRPTAAALKRRARGRGDCGGRP